MPESTTPSHACPLAAAVQCKQLKRALYKRRLGLSITFGCATMIFVTFQNFMVLPKDKISIHPIRYHVQNRVQEYRATITGAADIRDLAPVVPAGQQVAAIAVPNGGNTLESVRNNWLTQQRVIFMGDTEKQIVKEFNSTVNRFFNGEEAEAVPQQGPSRGPASVVAEPVSKPAAVVKMGALNRVDVQFQENTKLSCAVSGSSLDISLHQPVSEKFMIDVTHSTAQAQSRISLNYNW